MSAERVQYERSKLIQDASWQTPVRGTNDAEYKIYVANAESLGWTVKSYDEWLNS